MIKSVGFGLLWLAGSAAAVSVAWAGVSIVDDELSDPIPTASAVLADSSQPTGTAAVSPLVGSAAGTTAESIGLVDPTDSAGSGSTTAPGAFEASQPTSSSSTTGATNGATSASAGTGVTTSTTGSNGGPGSSTSSSSPTSQQPATTASSSTSSTSTVQQPAQTSTTTSGSSSTSSSTSTSMSTTTNTTTTQPAASTSTSTTTSSTTPTTQTTTSTTQVQTQILTFHLVGGSTAISFSPSKIEVMWAAANPGFTAKIEPESPGLKVEFRSDEHRSRVDAWWSNGPRYSTEEDD